MHNTYTNKYGMQITIYITSLVMTMIYYKMNHAFVLKQP